MFEERYEYNGYTIVETDDGVWVDDMEFVSYAEAVEWIDAQSKHSDTQVLHTYRVFFISPRGYRQNSVIVPDCIDEVDAAEWVKTEYCSHCKVVDVQLWD